MNITTRTHYQFARPLFWLMAIAAALLLNGPAFAVPADMSPDKTPYNTLGLKAESGLGGKLVRVQGLVGPGVKRFFVEDLDVMSPFSITVLAKDPAMPIKVSLHRWLWKEADAAGDTGGSGEWNYTGRLHKEVGIQLEADEPTEFYVLVWAGDPVPAKRMAFVQPASTLNKGASGGGEDSNTMLTVIIGLLVVVIALLAVMIFRKKGSGAAATIVAVVLASWAAQPTPAVASAIDDQVQEMESRLEGNREEPGEKPAEPDAKPDAESDWIAGKKPDEPEEAGKKPDELEEAGKKPDELEEAVKKPDAESAGPASGGDAARSFEDRIAAADNRIRDLQAQINTLADAIGELEFLIEQDRIAVPDEAPGGVAPMPSECMDDPDCSVCVVDAQQEMSGLLSDYERLRVIYVDTKNYADWMTNLGDAMSGWHQLEQAAWFQEKLNITKDVQGLQAAYDSKLEQFNGELEGYLRRIDRCEADNGNDGWYAREGQSFKQTIAFHYLRKN